ncbi:MAG: GMC family oxidoreductase N-terminal domain-containing protein [Bacteroidota bacterium]
MSNNLADYIIVGAGSAGCVLANRLSKDPSNQVILLEAGGKDTSPLVHIPGAYSLLNRSSMDWAFETVPQPHLANRNMYCPRGKVLGGSSSTNAMAYVRGNRQDYDRWASLGNVGWSFEEVLPYFKRSEGNAQADSLDLGYHNSEGELHVSYNLGHQTPLAEAFIESCDAYGITRTQDYNGASQFGSGLFQFTIKNGVRQSTARAFLHPVMGRSNVKVITQAHVTKLLVEGDRVVGVSFSSSNGSTTELKANKEVILAAGAYASPQLLLLSGIGPKEELATLGIPCLLDLPGVGKNLQDHLMIGVSKYVKGKNGFNHGLKPLQKIKYGFQYAVNKKGILTCSPLESVAFFNLDDLSLPPNFQFQFAPIHIGPDLDAVDFYNANSYPKGQDGATILASMVCPESVGELTLSSNDPFAPPCIDNHFLEAEKDRESLIKGVRMALEVFEQKAFQEYVNGDQRISLRSTGDEILQHIYDGVETIYHPVGTCKMGIDEMAVVDPELRLYGLRGLRIADASIMPRITTGNTNAPTIMIAEKCADMVLGEAISSMSRQQVNEG